METKWSNEKIVAEHKSIEADVMCVNHTGKYVALANPRMLYIIDFDNPSTILRSLQRSSKWEVTASEWSPHQTHLFGMSYHHYVAIYSFADLASNEDSPSEKSRFHKARTPEIIIKGHRRNVTDINWSPFDRNALATCSMDTFVNIWDIRDTRRPGFSFSSVVGLNQVKWSKSDENILAAAMEGDVRILDKRNSSIPLHYISAHEQRIHGLDWNPYQGSQFATCSQDGTVKFWELNNLARNIPTVLPTKLPAWRAKFTPFRNGLITVVVPQLRRTGDINSLWLWNTHNLEQPQHSFFGPTDVVIDFGWRWRPDSRVADLITWSKDSCLRIWTVDKQILGSFNEQSALAGDDSLDSSIDGFKNPNIFICNTININNRDSPLARESPKSPDDKPAISSTEFADRNRMTIILPKSSEAKEISPSSKTKQPTKPLSSSQKSTDGYDDLIPVVEPLSSDLLTPPDLQEEFALMNLEIPNLIYEDLNYIKRHCIVSISQKNGTKFRLQIKFPDSYPNKVAPIFEILDENDCDKMRGREIIRILEMTAQRQVKHNRPCLEPCLRDFVATLERKISFSSNHTNNTSPSSDYSTLYGSFHDAQVPFPRICGGRFCSADLLVCFGKMPYLHKISESNERTPRALSDLSAYLQTNYRPFTPAGIITTEVGSSKDNFPISSYPYYYSEDRKARRLPIRNADRSRASTFINLKCGPIYIFKVSNLMPCSKILAEKWIFDYKDRVSMCKKNANQSLEANRKDLHLTWTLASLSADPISPSSDSTNIAASASASDLAPTFTEHNTFLEAPWGAHPFGRKMIQSLIDFYLKTLGDIQTAAMLCCLFSNRCDNCGKLNCSQKQCTNDHGNTSEPASGETALYYSAGESPYHTVTGTPAVTNNFKISGMNDWSLISAFRSRKRNRSNSWSNPVENEVLSSFHILNSYRINCNEMALLRDQREAEKYELDGKMLDPKFNLFYECVKLTYADLLLRWGLLDKRALLMKYVADDFCPPINTSKSIGFMSFCQSCKEGRLTSQKCDKCKKSIAIDCSLCNVKVRGLVSFCLKCGHGGHIKHLHTWFELENQSLCPTGCGCKCLLSTG
ncbi:WD repeat domain 59 isoform X2 [Brevipalpus obovatus]|uniref:WD repeat domain 59 isoform X2 n=1 Tax=Brevipalpus obovatus TaxID=246614 RepID=UPI003D9E16F7